MQALTQRAAAWLLGIGVRALRDWDAPRNPDGTYDAQALVEWFAARNSPDDNPMLDGSGSPALERYRSARADREELELAARREQLIDMEEFFLWYDTEIAQPIHRAMEKLQAKFGKPAAKLMAQGLQASKAAVARRASGGK